MSERMQEKAESTQGPEKRLTADAVKKLSDAMGAKYEKGRSGSKMSVGEKMQRRSGSIGSIGSLDGLNKFDPKLKQ